MDALPQVRRTDGQLADGRAITYYDRPDAPVRSATDLRTDLSVATSSELRWDALVGEWVVVAGHRQERTYHPRASACPLCPSTSDQWTEIPERDYQVAVFENRFPALTATTSAVPSAAGFDAPDGIAGGRCEVVCYSDRHDASAADLDPDRMTLVLQTWIDRTEVLRRDPHVQSILVFENRGREIGVTLDHPHGQIYAYPFVGPRDRAIAERVRTYRERHGRDLHADLIAAEVRSGERVVVADPHWVAFVPFAARWPFHVRIYPLRPVADLTELQPDEISSFAPLYLSVLRALDAVFGRSMPLIAAWHQGATHGDRTGSHAFMEISGWRRGPDRLKYLAGSESAGGVWISDVPAERSAAMLREALIT
jgi:UDPglucose--hexose-1-phosphate uridylyltransferase